VRLDGSPSFIALFFSLFFIAEEAEPVDQELATQNGRNLLLAGQLFSTTLPTVQEAMGWGEHIETAEAWDDQRFTLPVTIAINRICLVFTSPVLTTSLTVLAQTVLLTSKSQANFCGLIHISEYVTCRLLWLSLQLSWYSGTAWTAGIRSPAVARFSSSPYQGAVCLLLNYREAKLTTYLHLGRNSRMAKL
jgi:hypothetical protein